MKNVKQTVILALSLVVSASIMLSGCKPNKDNTQVSNPDKTKLEPYELSVYYPGGGVQKDNTVVEEEINNYLKDKINATVKLNLIDWGSWGDKINMMMASSQPFDILFTAGWDNYNNHIGKKGILQLDELINQHGKEMKALIEKEMPKTFLDDARRDGKIYAIPVQKEMASQQGIVFNKKFVDQYKFDIKSVKKIQDIEPMLQKIKENEKDVIPFLTNAFAPSMLDEKWNNFSMLNGHYFPGALKKSDGAKKVVNQFETEEFKQFLKFARDWYNKGYIAKDAANYDHINIQKTGKWFVMIEPLKPGKDGELSQSLGFPVVQQPLFKPSVVDSTGSMMAISRTSKNPERAMMFLNLLHTDKKLVNLSVFGVESKHYVKVSDNIIDYPAGMDAKTSTYNPGSAWIFGNQFNNYIWKNEDPQKWEKFKAFNKEAETSLTYGFSFTPDKVKTEVAAINNVVKEFMGPTMTGSVDPDTVLPKFLEKLKAAGVEKVITEMQAQIDEYWKNKK